jgi:serine/threonine-protein kinase
MGEVWLAEDIRLDRQVALKMVRAEGDASSRTRLMKEARAAAALNNPYIATVHDVLEHDGEIVVVFEYVEGETLQSRIKRGPIPAPEAVEIATQIAKGLAGAHASGVVHRDLKPANVIIGAGGHIKILDFGIARILSRGTTQTNSAAEPKTASVMGFVGTASYAAPEQMVSSAVDERADLYALGVVLFEMISGRPPFIGSDPVRLATSKLGTDAPKLSSTGKLVPPAIDALVASLLDRDRDQRPASANDVLAQLKHAYGAPSTAQLPQPRGRAVQLAIAATIVIVLTAGYALWNRPVAQPETASNPSPPVIAVLPLSNDSPDRARDILAAGIAESLITSLAPLRTVTVLSRAAVTEARNRSSDPRKVASDLGATYLIEGSLQESKGVLRISINLLRSDLSVAWADAVQGAAGDIFEVQSRLASLVAGALKVQLSPDERERMLARATSSPEAQAAYWQGRALLERRDVKGNLDAAAVSLQRALSLDARFALAQAALGEVYWHKYEDSRDPQWARMATDAGTSALKIDADEPAVRYALAVTLAGTGKPNEAIEELRHALLLQPNFDDARRQLGRVLAQTGRIDEAIAEYERAIALRPSFWGHYSALGNSLVQAGRWEAAVPVFQKVVDLQPDNSFGYQQLGFVHHNLGRIDDALRYYAAAIERQPSPQAFSNIGAIHHQRGDYQRAVDAYKQAIALRPNSHITHRNLGDALMKLGRTDTARESYLRAASLAEGELKINPKDGVTTAILAVYLQKSGQQRAATARIEQALGLAPKDFNIRYRAAVVSALQGKKTEAIEHLRLAIAGGFSRDRAGEDDDLSSIRDLPEFRTLTARKT